jgi:hypothetical protein
MLLIEDIYIVFSSSPEPESQLSFSNRNVSGVRTSVCRKLFTFSTSFLYFRTTACKVTKLTTNALLWALMKCSIFLKQL